VCALLFLLLNKLTACDRALLEVLIIIRLVKKKSLITANIWELKF
jgi:hypothetical protein